jgi:uncharacterized membrane protein YfcA
MDGAAGQFLGMAGIDGWIFAWLSIAALLTAFISAVAGTAGGLILLAIMAFVFPPVLLIPVHTVVQLSSSGAMLVSRWRDLMRAIVLPFALGAIIGAAAGGQIFVSLAESLLQLILGLSILVLAWVPRIARFGPERGRFVFVGFLTSFLGMFISATGTLLATFAAAVAPDRRNHIATVGGLMSIVHIAKLLAFAVLGVGFGSYAPRMAAMIVTSVAGTWLARSVLDRIPERLFRVAFQIILTCLALRLIWIAASGWE